MWRRIGAGSALVVLVRLRGQLERAGRALTHRGRKGERRGFAEADHAGLLDAAHQQLGGPIALIWESQHAHQRGDAGVDRGRGLAFARTPVDGPRLA